MMSSNIIGVELKNAKTKKRKNAITQKRKNAALYTSFIAVHASLPFSRISCTKTFLHHFLQGQVGTGFELLTYPTVVECSIVCATDAAL
jgi:hypothetical protein